MNFLKLDSGCIIAVSSIHAVEPTTVTNRPDIKYIIHVESHEWYATEEDYSRLCKAIRIRDLTDEPKRIDILDRRVVVNNCKTEFKHILDKMYLSVKDDPINTQGMSSTDIIERVCYECRKAANEMIDKIVDAVCTSTDQRCYNCINYNGDIRDNTAFCDEREDYASAMGYCYKHHYIDKDAH